MRAAVLFPVSTLLLARAFSASEPFVMWRSSASGVLAAPAPASTPPVTPPVAMPAMPLVVTYGSNRFAWSTRESVLIMPDVAGGSGRYVYALATATPLPAGLAFDSATGAFAGRVKAAGDFQFSILIRDAVNGASTTTAARLVVVE